MADKDKSDGIKSAVKQFEKDNNVKVKIVEKAYADQLESLRLDGPAGSGPDIITIPSDQIGTATTEGLLKPLTVSKATQKQYTDSAMQSQIVKGKVYGLPRTIETTFLYYNKKLLSEKDLPKTTDEWLTYSKQQVAAGKYGLLALWDQVYYAGGILSSYGGYIFNKDAKGNYDTSDIGLNNAGAVKAATYIKSFYDAGVFPKGILGDQGINTLDSLFTEAKPQPSFLVLGISNLIRKLGSITALRYCQPYQMVSTCALISVLRVGTSPATPKMARWLKS